MELAIAATDLAELIGSATALNLLFGIPVWAGVIITSLDVLLLLAWTTKRMRLLEAFIFALVAFIAVCFAIELSTVHPSWGHVFYGFVPKPAIITDSSLLYLGIGILGESGQLDCTSCLVLRGIPVFQCVHRKVSGSV
jgi:manganese transport protein